MLGHKPAQPAPAPEAEQPFSDEDQEQVTRLQEEHRVAELTDTKTSVETRLEILQGIRAALERHSTVASSSILLQRASLASIITVAPSDSAIRSAALEHLSRISISDMPKETITVR